MTFSSIREEVQNILRDYGERIYNTTLINSYINEGYITFVERSHCLQKNGSITISPNVAVYSLPSDCLSVIRYEWDSVYVPATTEMEMDAHYGRTWRTATGSSILKVAQDMEGEGYIRIYPRIAEDDYIGTLSTVVGSDGNDYYCILSHTSTTDDKPITGDDYPLYWKATGGTGEGDTWAAGEDYTKYLYLYLDYSYLPDEMSDDDDEPAIPSRWHKALSEFAVYRLQYQETKSKGRPIMGERHYDNYKKMVARAKMRTVKGFASSPRQRRATFPRFV